METNVRTHKYPMYVIKTSSKHGFTENLFIQCLREATSLHSLDNDFQYASEKIDGPLQTRLVSNGESSTSKNARALTTYLNFKLSRKTLK